MSLNKRNKILLSIAIVFIAAVFLVAIFFGATSDEEVTITIYHTNDMHGVVSDLSYVISLRDATPNSLLVDAGDPTQGTLLATTTNGAAIITLMNFAGYDLMTLGNHEFDKGASHAVELATLAEFPVLSANTLYPNGTRLLNNDGNVILNVGGKRIGFFGVTTTETNGPYSEFICTDEVSSAKNQTAYLTKEHVDLIVAVVHIGDDPVSNPTSYDLAKAVPEIDLIIDGHSHTVIQDKVGETTIVQTGSHMENLGKVEVTFTKNGPMITSSLIPAETLRQGQFDQKYADEYQCLENISSQGFDKVVGNTETPIYANGPEGERLVRMMEMPLGDLVADSLLWYGAQKFSEPPYNTLPLVALMNGGGVRADLAAGNITLEDAYTTLPFGNFVSVIVISPAELYASVENGVSGLPNADGRFSQVSGMRVSVDSSKDIGSRVLSIEIPDENGWRLLDRNDRSSELLLCTINYLAKGSEGYDMFAGKRILDQSEVDASVFAEYVGYLTEKGGGSFTYSVPERIHII